MKQYKDRTEQASLLASLVADQLNQAIATRDQAVLVVAGGSTPKLFLNHLSKSEINWSRVTVIPSDERWVDASHPRSNDRFVRENLLINHAGCARLVSLYVESRQPDEALDLLEARLKNEITKPDVCVLGMGEDAHIASLFPGADNLKAALDPQTQKRVMAMTAPGADEPRMTLTLALLLCSEHIHLLITGNNKLDTLNRAMQSKDVEKMPVASILNKEMTQIHYAQ